ncbi:MAG TPA: ATP-binding protein [Bryobacteraceae bacterium]|jgi:PAS domain S-box-containing protein|nr:ATP-binding protein [Bryobacteraceae bacterium]
MTPQYGHRGPLASKEPLAFLQGGAAAGELIRQKDWSQTPLGSTDGWSQSLRSAASICLGSGFPIAIYWGPELVLLYNDAWSPILGAKHPWALGRPAREVWPEIWSTIGPLFQHVTTTGEATRSKDQLLAMRRHGYTEECYFDYTFSPVRGESGQVEGIFNAVIETTERVVGERRLRTLRELAGSVADARTIELACRTTAQILGRAAADIPFALIYLLSSDGTEAKLMETAGLEAGTVASPLRISVSKTENEGASWPVAQVVRTTEAQLVDNLGTAFPPLPGGPWPESPGLAMALPISRVGSERPYGVLIAGVSPRRALDTEYRSFLDIVAGHISQALANAEANEEERKRAESLAELDRAKTAFFSNVSHEFRTPLTLMLGPLEEILGSSSDLPPAVIEMASVAHRNGLRLQKLVNTLLDFSRIEADRMQAAYEATDLTTLTADLASVFRSAVERAGLELVIDCAALREPVYVDREMWEKIVLNLISNAFKFTFEGKIEVLLREAGGAVELTVRDTGTGIPDEEIPRLFNRFHRVKGARGRSWEGSGIGLALVQELVQLHGGRVRVASEVGRGSSFIVSIPFGTAHLSADRIENEPVPAFGGSRGEAYIQEALRWLPDTSSPSLSRKHTRAQRILLADDNADMRDYVRRLLVHSGYEVEAVADGLTALRSAQARKPDLVLTDIMMPGLGGFEVLRDLRADAQFRDVPVILVSARAGEEARIEGMYAGADDYLTKPFSARELLARVESHLKMARFRQESAEAVRIRTAQFETLLNRAPLGVYVVDAEFRIREMNPIASSLFGNIPGGVVGRDFDEIVHILWERASADDLVSCVRRTLETGESHIVPERAEHRADRNETEYYEWRLDRILLPEGRFGVVCYFRDIGDHKRAEQTAHLLASIVASSDDAIVSKNLDGVIMSWNRGAERLFGYTAAEAVGQPIAILFPPDRLEEEPKILERLRRGERVDHFETIRVRKDGSRLNISLTISPIKDHHGRIVGASKVARDITERVRHEQAIQEANAALKRANADLQQFAYSASHDLQEPLRMVAVYSGLLREEFAGKLGSTGETYIGQTVRAAMQMENLLRDLRIYTQVSTAEIGPAEEIDAGEVLNKTLLNLEVLITESGAIIESAPLPRLRIYEFQLQQVLQNLIGNAIRYRSELTPSIAIGAERLGKEWLFSVRDNGIGIDPQFKERIFGIFKRLHSAHEYPGTGMGLAICQRVIERVGGRIWVESEPGKGSTFYFTIPGATPAQKESEHPFDSSDKR